MTTVDGAEWVAASRTASASRRRVPVSVIVAGLVFGVFIFGGVVGPYLLPYRTLSINLFGRLLSPGSHVPHGSVALLGTDQEGRDLLRQLVAGSRISLLVIFVTSVVAGGGGALLGLISGYFGGWIDAIVSRIGDIQLSFPGLLLPILLAGTLGPSVTNVIVALAATRWVVFARVVRGSAIKARQKAYVEAARAMGAPHVRVLLRYVLPECIPQLVVVMTAQVGFIAVGEASLSFLGLGVPLTQASWGGTIAGGLDYLGNAWWIATFPGLFLTMVVVAVGILGDFLRDVLDPANRSDTRA